MTVLKAPSATHMLVPSNAIGPGFEFGPRLKVPSVAPAGDSSTTSVSVVTHMFVPSKAIALHISSGPTLKVRRVAPAGDSSMTSPPSLSTTHMFVPSNAIAVGRVPAGKEPSDPHVGRGTGVQAARTFLHAPGARDATGPSGARQSSTSGGQTLQGPTVQSLSCAHVVPHASPAQPYGAQLCGGGAAQRLALQAVPAGVNEPPTHVAWQSATVLQDALQAVVTPLVPFKAVQLV